MAINLSRKKVIIITAVLLVLIAGGVAAYILVTGQLNQPVENNNGSKNPNTSGNAYQERLSKVQTEVTDLVAVGDEQSIEEADQILNSEVKTAKDSGNDAYIVEATSAKASLLIETDRTQEALDLLLALERDYGSEDAYKYELYGMISYAYKGLDNQAKSDEYLNKIPGGGWD
jgi:flagellar basal body-associated protein FliL